MYRIMIIEDDSALRKQMQKILEAYSYEIIAVTDFLHIEEIFLKEKPELVILDINLPYYDGNYFCHFIRKNSKVPVIITSARNSDMDQIMSIELGADEYVVKPFSMQVLLAKINAIMRRLYGEYAERDSSENIVLKGMQLNWKKFSLHYDNQTLELTKNEVKLLKMFFRKPNQVIAREELLEELWDTEAFVDDNTLTVNIARLKQKLESIGLQDVIKTKRGSGYLFDTQEG